MLGGYEVLDHLEETLGVRTGETTADGSYTLSEVECLASCGSVPMFQVTYSDGEMEYYEDLTTTAKVDAVLAKLNERLASLPDPRRMHDAHRAD
jgi:NADH:ubiquinone oxidoreductase subunit E